MPTLGDMLPHPIVICIECKRRFNLYDPVDADDWYHGHDCET